MIFFRNRNSYTQILIGYTVSEQNSAVFSKDARNHSLSDGIQELPHGYTRVSYLH